jgi:hypothetical protein
MISFFYRNIIRGVVWNGDTSITPTDAALAFNHTPAQMLTIIHLGRASDGFPQQLNGAIA